MDLIVHMPDNFEEDDIAEYLEYVIQQVREGYQSGIVKQGHYWEYK